MTSHIRTVFLTLLSVMFLSPLWSGAAYAQPRTAICFDSKANLVEVLDRVTNQMQMLAANDQNIVRGGNCAWVQPPSGQFAAYWAGWHTSENGFIFPVFQLDYDNDGLKRFATDGIFSTSQWALGGCNAFPAGPSGKCLVPKSCDIFRNFIRLTGGFVPNIMYHPPQCQVFRG